MSLSYRNCIDLKQILYFQLLTHSPGCALNMTPRSRFLTASLHRSCIYRGDKVRLAVLDPHLPSLGVMSDVATDS